MRTGVLGKLAALAAGGVLAVLTAGASAQGAPPARVRTEPARLERVEQRREATGEIRASRRSSVAAREAGQVLEVLVREGDAVQAGDPLARLDTRRQEIEVRRAEAELASASALVVRRRAELKDAELDLGRIRELTERSSASRAELDNAEVAVETARAAVAEAEAEVSVAEAELADARQRLEDMAIVAPYAGRVIARMTEAGQWVREGDGVVDLVSMDGLEAWVDVPERVVDRLRDADAPITLRVEAIGREIPARLIAIVPDADRLSRTFPVRLAVEQPGDERAGEMSGGDRPDDPEALKPGMSVVALVPTGAQGEFVTVHKDAVRRDDAGEYVFYDAGGMAMAARVQRIFAFGDRVAIREGQIRPGTPVIVEGNERVFPTQPLVILNAGGEGGTQNGPGSGPAAGGADGAAGSGRGAEGGRENRG